ncbi:MAG: YihY family inner membrane protein [Planctomycetes bacterium]|nr:YihY family inner membrane protein [Planctomycetota bacterium]
MKALRWIVKVIREVVKNDLPNHAAEMAYFAMMAVFPFFLLLTTVVAFLPVPDLFAVTMARLRDVAPEEMVGLLQETIREVTTVRKTNLLGATLLVCLWMSAGAMSSTTRGLNKAFGLKDPRRYVRFFGLSLVMTCLLGLLLIIAILLLLLGPRIESFVLARISLGWFGEVLFVLLRNMVPIFFLFLTHAGLYWLCPAVKRRFRVFTPGTFFSVLGWIAVSYGFKLYLDQVNNYDKLYGSLGAVIISLFWFYLMSMVLLIGAQIDAVLHPEYKTPVTESGDPIRQPFPWKLLTVFLLAMVGIPVGIRGCLSREDFTPQAHSIGGKLAESIARSLESGQADMDHDDLGALLAAVVDDQGLVDYPALEKRADELDHYLRRFEDLDIAGLQAEELKAALINLYNASALRLVLHNFRQVHFINDIPARDDRAVARLAGQPVSLSNIRDGMLRTDFADARSFFALCDGSRGSPPLMPFAYEGERLSAQLDEVTRRNLRPPRTVVTNGKVELPAVVDRFKSSFQAMALDGRLSSALAPYVYDAAMAMIHLRGDEALSFRNEDPAINRR